jgi:hypothetical protein
MFNARSAEHERQDATQQTDQFALVDADRLGRLAHGAEFATLE